MSGSSRKPNPNNLSGYLQRKAEMLGLDRADQLAQIQAYLDEKYPKMCRAVSINDGVLAIRVANASLASELRMSQLDMKKKLPSVKKIIIRLA